MRKLCIAAVASLFVVAMSASAAQELNDVPSGDTGNSLKAELTGTERGHQGFAAGYILGMAHGLLVSRSACFAEGVPKKDVVEVVKAFVNDNPALLHESRYWIVEPAVSQTFPCKTNRGG